MGYFGDFGASLFRKCWFQHWMSLPLPYTAASSDPAFQRELSQYLANYVGRPTPLYFAGRLSESIGHGVRIYLKREVLGIRVRHKINNAMARACSHGEWASSASLLKRARVSTV